jgi:sulfhydrogenase subunit beta (sulfur reductase)
METILKKDRLGAWMELLAARAQVFAPRLADGIWNFAPADVAAPRLDHSNTVRPAKGFVFPQREVLYRFRQEAGKAPQITATVPGPEPIVVFGVRPCDGRALVRNDKVFACAPVDPYYQARRDGAVFVGLACSAPTSNCFCQEVGGSPHSEDGLDVLMT